LSPAAKMTHHSDRKQAGRDAILAGLCHLTV
jgi:hypothetical protein